MTPHMITDRIGLYSLSLPILMDGEILIKTIFGEGPGIFSQPQEF